MTDRTLPSDTSETRIDFGAVARAVLGKMVRIVFVTILLCALAYAVTLFMPRLYESSASILIEPRTNAYTRATLDQDTVQYLVDDAQIASQIELVQSRSVLSAAIEAVDLSAVEEYAEYYGGEAPRTESILEEVRDHLIVARERESRLIRISFRSTDAQIASQMANAIAAAHVRQRAGQQISDTADATTWLDQEIDRLRDSVADAEAQVADFRVTNDMFVGTNNTSLVDQQLSGMAEQITAASERRNAARTRAEQIRERLAAGEPVSGLPAVQESATVQELSQQLAQLQGDRARQSSTLLSNHPTIRALDAQIAELRQQIASESQQIAASLEAEAQSEADLEASLRGELDQLKQEAGVATRDGVTLAELEREAAAQRELLNAYLLRYSEAASRADGGSALPDVRVVSAAAPALNPVSPKTKLILFAVGLVAVTLQVGGVIFGELLSGRALRARNDRDVEPAIAGAGVPETKESEEGSALLASGAETGAAEAHMQPEANVIPFAVAASDENELAVEQEAAPVHPELTNLPHGHGVFTATTIGYWVEEGAAFSDSGVSDPEDSEVQTAAQAEDPSAVAPWAEQEQESAETVAATEDLPETDAEDDILFDPGTEPLLAPAAVASVTTDGPEASHPQGVSAVPEDEPEREEAQEPDPAAQTQVPSDESETSAVDADGAEEIDAIATAILAGRSRLVIVAGAQNDDQCFGFAQELGARILENGQSLVQIDAASVQPGSELGLTDLAAGGAEFGDVVHRGSIEGLAYVPWGQAASLDRRSDRVPTLVEALGDVYEAVVVVTGKVGMRSTLPLFAHLDAPCLVLGPDGAETEAVREEVAALGYEATRLTFDAHARSAVA